VPFNFQQKLSAHKTPTLGDAIRSFDQMFMSWINLQRQYKDGDPEPSIIQKGIDKLNDYYERMDDVPAYTIAMSELILILIELSMLHVILQF